MATIFKQKVLLCRPNGGLNDTLCQIWKCLEYAERFSRDLVIDARMSGLMGDFDDFFVLDSGAGVTIYPRLETQMKPALHQSCYPVGLSHPLDYQKRYDKKLRKIVDAVSGTVLTFDFSRDYAQHLLIHDQCGGGNPVVLLRRLTLAQTTRDFVLASLARLPRQYSAIHVRNTDYQTNYQAFFAKLRAFELGPNVLVCSDDRAVIEYAMAYFPDKNILDLGHNPPVAAGKPLHRSSYESDDVRLRVTRQAITDLLALANADTLYYHSINNQQGRRKHWRSFFRRTTIKPVFSGFSLLADTIHRDKCLLDQLLYAGEPSCGIVGR